MCAIWNTSSRRVFIFILGGQFFSFVKTRKLSWIVPRVSHLVLAVGIYRNILSRLLRWRKQTSYQHCESCVQDEPTNIRISLVSVSLGDTHRSSCDILVKFFFFSSFLYAWKQTFNEKKKRKKRNNAYVFSQ